MIPAMPLKRGRQGFSASDHRSGERIAAL